MWGRFYWGRKEEGGKKAVGFVVLFAWLSSHEKHLKPYVDLYWSLGWGSLVCHVDFLTLFFPERASKLARVILDELIKEVKVRPLPIVLVAFSGGSKGGLYKVLQLVEGKCQGQNNLQDDYRLVGECLSGQIYDSSPTDFTSEIGSRFVLHPSILRLSHPPRVLMWMAKGFASGLDALFINRFEADRAEYWQTLYSSVCMGPFLILCSEDDELVPYKISWGFAKRLQELGGDVSLVKWSSSPHVAHYRYHRAEYTAAVTDLLAKASLKFSRMRQHHQTSCKKASDSVCNSHVAAVSSCESLKRYAAPISASDHFLLPSSMEFDETRDGGSLIDVYKGELFQLPSIKTHGVLSQILFDVCVPKNIEDWDIKPVSSLIKNHVFSTAMHGPFNPVKCIKRSKL
ncbi:uncharacterized protein LOC110114405 [Dendrobium catenatum]|uniref:Transmembrane protein 53 n=1 Tax=Dendrobium catenatum TaxID=906689 RepID=A0A2I0VXG1_9ASPA|nr:uncharacterized protein LOC110114405 [Dendrobium catenatum]PKU68101.1 hypothetical protein MA16_Dca026820 [Dendrobium catenatum]